MQPKPKNIPMTPLKKAINPMNSINEIERMVKFIGNGSAPLKRSDSIFEYRLNTLSYYAPHCARCLMAWSQITSAAIDSTIGNARGRTQGYT